MHTSRRRTSSSSSSSSKKCKRAMGMLLLLKLPVAASQRSSCWLRMLLVTLQLWQHMSLAVLLAEVQQLLLVLVPNSSSSSSSRVRFTLHVGRMLLLLLLLLGLAEAGELVSTARQGMPSSLCCSPCSWCARQSASGCLRHQLKMHLLLQHQLIKLSAAV
jgi:hypothetical protein